MNSVVAYSRALQRKLDLLPRNLASLFPIYNENSELRAAIGRLLHLPDRQVATLLWKNKQYLRDVECLRNQYQPTTGLQHHIGSFKFDQQSAFVDFAARDSRSRLLVSFHFGDFIYGNNILASHETGNRKQYFFTQLEPKANFSSNMQRAFDFPIGGGPVQLTSKSATAFSLVKILKTESTTLLTFMDLPPGFGKCTYVQFFGRKARFPVGPATLALMARVPILPIINLRTEKTNQIKVFPLIETDFKAKESLQHSAQTITQQLANYLERAIGLYPWQWRFLSALPSYFSYPEAKDIP